MEHWQISFHEEVDDAAWKYKKEDFTYTVIDLETTGLKASEEGITEMVALNYVWNQGLRFSKTMVNQLTNPLKPIPKVVVELNGITDDMVKHKENYVDVVQRFNEMTDFKSTAIRWNIMVAHNAKFEYDFLTYIEDNFEDYKWLCTRALYLYMRDGNTWENNFKRNYSNLINVCGYLGIAFDEAQAHRAEYDVLKTSEVLAKMLKVIPLEKALDISEKYIKGKHYGTKRQIGLFEEL